MVVTLEHDDRAVSRLAECVEKDPERLGGEPVFRGTRVPVKSLFDHLIAGDSLGIFLDDFPGVTRYKFARCWTRPASICWKKFGEITS